MRRKLNSKVGREIFQHEHGAELKSLFYKLTENLRHPDYTRQH